MKKEILVPVKEDGSLLSYVSRREIEKGEVWGCGTFQMLKPTPFEATLELHDFGRGRSSVTFEFTNKDTGATYPMFVKEMFTLVRQNKLNCGVISGWWVFIKRGTNYGIKFLGKDDGEHVGVVG